MRYLTTVESVAGLSGSVPAGANANGLFAVVAASANSGGKLRRLTLGCRASTGAPSSQQVTVAAVRTTARGTATTTAVPNPMDPNGPAAQITGVDTAWSAVPTVTSWTGYIWEASFNTQSGLDIPWEQLEELIVPKGIANGLAFINVANVLPLNHLLTATFEHEE